MNRARHVFARVVWLAFIAVAVGALFTTAQVSVEKAFADIPAFSYVLGLAVAIGTLMAVYKWGDFLCMSEDRITKVLCRVSLSRFLLVCLLAGIALRLAWVALFPAPLRSDAFGYFDLASKLAQGHEYQSFDRGDFAYWPPGYPFLLSMGLKLLGPHHWVVTVVNLVLFSVSMPLVYALARWIADEKVGRFSALLLVIWPNYLASAGLGSKEMVVVPCLLLMFLLYFRSRKTGTVGGVISCLVAGGLLGFASLTQPSFLLLPVVLLAYEWLSNGLPKGFVKLAFVLLSMVAVIFPWTLRNKAKLGQWVVISDNGGDVLYRANNAWATGGYVPGGEQTLPENEVQRNKVGYQLGKRWIWHHPGKFLWLAGHKLTLFLGDDGWAVYESLKRGLGISGWRYLLFRALSNGYWFLVWTLILSMLLQQRRTAFSFNHQLLALMLSFLYFLAIHSLFESDSRHHVPLIGVMSILAAGLVYRAKPQSEQRDPHSATL